jgi:hypothetical protein
MGIAVNADQTAEAACVLQFALLRLFRLARRQ